MATTLFAWGYFGWGNATDQLIRVVDAVERDRGFAPPLFVDARIRRSVRAKGFQGSAFAERLGPARHRWMRGLGNEAIRTGEGGIRISDPSQADALLDLTQADDNRRVLFFCSCQWPMTRGQVTCHRRTVGDLVLEAARRRGDEVEVVEWPGGEPGEASYEGTPEILTAVRRGRASVPLGASFPAAELRALAWGSTLHLRGSDDTAEVFTGPARFHAGAWELPILELLGEEAGRGVALRSTLGLEARRTGTDHRSSC